jgi:hypothetical protein
MREGDKSQISQRVANPNFKTKPKGLRSNRMSYDKLDAKKWKKVAEGKNINSKTVAVRLFHLNMDFQTESRDLRPRVRATRKNDKAQKFTS